MPGGRSGEDPGDDRALRAPPWQGGDGRRRAGDPEPLRDETRSPQDPAPLPRQHSGRIRRRGGRRLRAVHPVRGEARGISRQPGARGRRAGARLAHRPEPAAPGGAPAGGLRQEVVSSLGHRRFDRARRRSGGHWLGRSVRGRGRAGPGATDRDGRPGDRRGGAEDRRGDRRVHQRPHPGGGAVMVERLPRAGGDGAARLAEPPAELSPRQIVEELDRYIVGQEKAKRAVAIALRNRLRRLKVPPDMAEEVAPKNIIMIGPTGVGKTEIARRLARLAGSPFIKVEASKYTEVGYVGRDVESMVRDLVDIALEMVKTERAREVAQSARAQVEERLLDILLPSPQPAREAAAGETEEPFRRTREKLRQQLREGQL